MSKTIAGIVDLAVFFVLLLVFDWGFAPAFGVSLAVGWVTQKVLER
jgi:hypothetical protein